MTTGARLAGIQRLLGDSGYDAAPSTESMAEEQAALTAFLKSLGLSADIVPSQNFFTHHDRRVQSTSSTG